MGRTKFIIVLSLVFGAGIGFAGIFNLGLAFTNEMDFCTSCHSMKTNLEEYKTTVHYQNRTGVRATCADCHVPKEFGPKMVAKVLAYKDVMHEILGTLDTPEKYEQHRWGMANRVWDKMRATNSRECRSCHDFSQMDLSLQTRSARKRHSSAEDEGAACIDCHKGIAHKEPEEPDTATDAGGADKPDNKAADAATGEKKG